MDDLVTLDPSLYKNLLFVKQYEGNVEDLSLYFCIDEDGELSYLVFCLSWLLLSDLL